MDMKNVIIKRENMVFNVKMEYSKKEFGQKCIDYLGPKNYNLMPVNIKWDIFYIEGNRTTMEIKKKFRFGYFQYLNK